MRIVEGPVTAGTKLNLVRGIRGKPLSEVAVNAIATQACGLIEKTAARYDEDVARGEVGEGGTATASAEQPVAGRGPTGLLYGRVQSGKTAAMTLASAVAFDNGFRVVIVVTANNIALVRQTADRLKAIAGPRVFSTLKDAADYEWEGQEADLKEDLPQDGIVIACAKDRTHLPAVIRLLQHLEAAAVPALIFDDEADAATPDTTLAARTSGRQNAPLHESTMYRNIIENTHRGKGASQYERRCRITYSCRLRPPPMSSSCSARMQRSGRHSYTCSNLAKVIGAAPSSLSNSIPRTTDRRCPDQR